MKNSLKHNENVMLVMCLFGEAMAYLYAMLLRYVILNWFYTNPTREYDFYKVFIWIVLFFYMAVFQFRRKRRVVVWKQEFADKVFEVIKQQATLLICLLLFLFFIGWSNRISRTVMAALIGFGLFFDLFIRWQYGKFAARSIEKERKTARVLLIAREDESERLKWCIEQYGYRNEWKDFYRRCEVTEQFSPEDLKKDGVHLTQEADLVYLSSAAAEEFSKEEIDTLERSGIALCRELEWDGCSPETDMVVRTGGKAAVFRSFMNHKSPVLGVNYTTASISEVAGYLIRHAEDLAGEYICFSNVHTTVMAADDPEYREILNHSALTFPDGMPVAKKIREAGFPEAERVAGPDLMEALFKKSMGTGRKHYFYGSSEKTIAALEKNLKERYPWMEIVGMVSPPFRALTEEEDAAAVAAINESGADFVWIGLGAPKQEKWMNAHRGRINGVMLGVGAGFDFHAGTIRRAPSLIRRLGLEWFYRLLQNPGRLLKRYVITNTKFLIYTKLKKGERRKNDGTEKQELV